MKQKVHIFLVILACISLGFYDAKGQSPGGVAPAAWYRADAASLFSDAGVTPAANNSTVHQWNSQVGSFSLVQSTNSYKPVYSNTVLANFNPTVTFDGSNDYLQFTAPSTPSIVNVIDRANGTIMAAGYMDRQKGSGFAGFHASMDFPGLHVFSNYKFLFFTSGGPGYQGQSDAVMQPQRYFTAGSGWQNDAATVSGRLSARTTLNGAHKVYEDNHIYNVNLGNPYRDFRVGGDSNYGAFSGQLNEVMVFEDKLTEGQMDQVETYLAVKYGTTFADGTRNYVNSSGDPVWTAASNNGFHHNIAGIGRDGALYQKQSWSTNPGSQVLIGLDELANTNAANAGTLTNGQYLIWGDNGEAKVPTVATSVFGGLSHHFAAIWKVENTGAVGTVRVAWPKSFSNLTLIQSDDDEIGAGDAATSMSGEIEINGVTYNYADVTLDNGSYFTFGAKLSGPGGVTAGLMMWHKADDGTVGAGAKSIWRDVSGLGRDVTQNNNPAYQPLLVTNATHAADNKQYSFNFNPFYYFDGTNDFFYREGDLYFPDINSAGSTYGVMFNSNRGGWHTPYGWADDDPNFFRWDGRYEVWRENSRPLMTTDMDARALPANIGGMSWRGNGINGIYMNIDGKTYSTASYHMGTLNNNRNPPNFAIGSEGHNVTGAGNEHHQGGISEVFAYSIDHQNSGGDEKQRINSYLAIKYGITLKDDAGTGVPDYLSSNSTVVWDATANSDYNNNIAGIARDDNSALYQKQSRSNKDGQQVLIGTPGLANTNAANASTLDEGRFLIWGDNGLAKSLGVAHSTTVSSVDLNLRFASVWKVQNTGSVGGVRVAWPSGIVNLHLIQSADDVITTADVHTPMTGVAVINGVAYNYADVTLDNGSFFTFGGYIAGPGGVGQDLSLWYRADNGVETDGGKKVTGWNNSTANEVKLTMSSANAYIPYNDQTTFTKTWNFNPTLSFDGTNNYLRNVTTPYINASASVHYIAVARLNAVGTYNSLFAISGNDDGFFLANSGGNASPMPTINNYVNIAATGPVSTNRFGIYSAILPRSGTTPNQRGFTNGLEKVYTSAYPRTGSNYTLDAPPAANNGAFIGADGTTGDNPNGDIAEVILYQEPTGGDMTNANLQRIHSYLAIKYGITLDQSTPQDYINSSSDVVWDATVNEDYNANIAGIGRDDHGGLYQKQSNSVNPGNQVLISTPGLAGTNATNTATLTNGQFLVWGDNGLSKSPSVPFATIGGLPYQRFAAVWKAQNTDNVGTVRVAWRKGYANLKLIQNNSDATFAGGNTVTDMSGTQVVNGVEYAYADVNIADGQYFTFAAFLQAPGGVTAGILMWHKANDGAVAGAGGTKDTWVDVSGNGRDVFQPNNTNNEPLLVTDATYSANSKDYFFNYNPFYYFDGSNDFFYNEGETYFPSTTSAGSTYGVMHNSNAGGYNTAYGWGNDDPNLVRAGNDYQLWRNDGHPLSMGASLNATPAHIGGMAWIGATNGLYINVNGKIASTPSFNIGEIQSPAVNENFAIGSEGLGLSNNGSEQYQGGISEVFAYSVDHQNSAGDEKARINSYLAIKYGITLSNDAGTDGADYLSSSSVKVWDATANSGYNSNIAGLAHDFMSALHQKQSRSVNANSQVTIGLGEIAETNIANANGLSDGQFLLWGDNGNTQAMTNVATTFTAFDYAGGTNNARRMNRVWKVQNTGVSNETLIRFPVASVGTTTLPVGDNCANYAILFADDAAFTTNLQVVQLTVNEADYDVLHSFPNGTSYFTYAKLTPLGAGIVILPDVTEETDLYDAVCNVGEWTYFHKDGATDQKLIAFSGFSGGEMDEFTVTITPQGVGYDDGTRITNLMARVTTVTDEGAAYSGTKKIRVYYDADELAATTVPGELINGWFKYDGNADDAIVDIFSDGLLDPTKAEAITAVSPGIEDGVAYVEFHGIESFSSFIYISSTESSPLPVTLTSFRATREGESSLLSWSTTSELGNKGFDVERSADARNWTTLGFVGAKAAEGNSSRTLDYTFTDPAPLSGQNYYRLKQLDVDGKYEHSHVVVLNFKQENGHLYVYPNPVTAGELALNLPDSVTHSVKVYTLAGVEVLRGPLKNNVLNVRTLSSGQYILQITSGDGEIITRTFIIK